MYLQKNIFFGWQTICLYVAFPDTSVYFLDTLTHDYVVQSKTCAGT
jgi:hypothetical protein